jgi:hypothetical protein
LFNLLSPKSSRSRSGYVVAAAQFAAVIRYCSDSGESALRETIANRTCDHLRCTSNTRDDHRNVRRRVAVNLTVPTKTPSLAGAFSAGPEVAQSTQRSGVSMRNADEVPRTGDALTMSGGETVETDVLGTN